MRRSLILGAVGLACLCVPIVLAAVLKGGGQGQTAPPARVPAPRAAASPVVLARQDGNNALTVAVQAGTIRVNLLGPQGNGLAGHEITIAGKRASSCGAGCYAVDTSARGVVPITVDGRRFTFVIPKTTPAAAALMRRATNAFRSLRSVTYVERLASSTRNHIVTTFTLERPNRVEYRIHGGADGIVIGTKRWDRTPGSGWSESDSTPLPQPSPVWGSPVTDAHVLSRTRNTVVISFLNPGIPAWFEARFDAHTMLPRRLDMIAASHFMHHVYTRYDAPRRIFPPR